MRPSVPRGPSPSTCALTPVPTPGAALAPPSSSLRGLLSLNLIMPALPVLLKDGLIPATARIPSLRSSQNRQIGTDRKAQWLPKPGGDGNQAMAGGQDVSGAMEMLQN